MKTNHKAGLTFCRKILFLISLFLLFSCTAEQFIGGVMDVTFSSISYGGKLKTPTVIYFPSKELENNKGFQKSCASRNLIISTDSLCCRYSIQNISEYELLDSKSIKYDFIDRKTGSVKHYDKSNTELDGSFLYDKVAGHLVYLIKRIEKKEKE